MIPLNVRWIAQTEISIAEDSELLELMAASGCQWIVVGFESVSPDSLKGIEDRSFKKRRLPAYPANIRRIQDEGIGITAHSSLGWMEMTYPYSSVRRILSCKMRSMVPTLLYPRRSLARLCGRRC